MKKTEFRGPLLQSAVLLVGTIILATIAASAGNGSSGGGILAIVAGIGNFVLFVIGLTIGLAVSIAILIGIFLAAVAMVSPEQASQMYLDLKKNFFQGVLICSNLWSCCDKGGSAAPVDLEEHSRMKQEIIRLQNANLQLNDHNNELQRECILIKENVAYFQADNSSLQTRIEELNHEIEGLIKQVNELELGSKQPSASGIFSYIDNEVHQTLFIEKVTEALKQEMTYAQIDDYLSKALPADLDKIIKDHPALTRNYIRNLR